MLEFERDFRTFATPEEALDYLCKIEAVENIMRKVEFGTVVEIFKVMAASKDNM